MAAIKISAKLKKAITENLLLKMASLLVSIILWILVSGERNTEWSYLVPLDIVDQPSELIITNNFPRFLDVRLQGSQNFIRGLNPKDMVLQLDLSDIKPGSNIIPITADLIKAPRGAAVTRINPSYITFDVETLVRKKVTLDADIQGKPAHDFFVESVEIIPQVIDIMGAESEAKNIRTLRTVAISISGANSDINKEVQVDIRGRKVIIDRKDPVIVNVKIKEVSAKLELKDVRPEVINSRYRASLKPEKINIMIEGPKSLVNSMKEGGIVAQVNAGDLKPGAYKKDIEFKLPDGVRLIYSYPKNVTLRVSDKEL